MNRTLLVLAVSFSLCIGSTPLSVLADEGKDGQEIEQSANEINAEAQSDSGKAAVVNRLKNEFSIEESQINDLRSKNLGYGEIGIALSLAQQMPGGITNENIQKVMDLRRGEGKRGWGNVAKELNLNLGKVVSQTQKMATERQTIKKPDTKQMQSQETFEPISERPASGGKPEGGSKPMHTPGGGKGRQK
jgi:hypothetical protein